MFFFLQASVIDNSESINRAQNVLGRDADTKVRTRN